MTDYTANEARIADLMGRMDTEVQAPAPARNETARRTVIVPDVDAPKVGYRVVLGDKYGCTIAAPSRGEAVLVALDLALASEDPNLRNASAYVFLWNYTVTDSDGVTVYGVDMREEVQTARMARSAARARRSNG